MSDKVLPMSLNTYGIGPFYTVVNMEDAGIADAPEKTGTLYTVRSSETEGTQILMCAGKHYVRSPVDGEFNTAFQEASAGGGGSTVDTSKFATKDELKAKADKTELDKKADSTALANLATKEDVNKKADASAIQSLETRIKALEDAGK